MVTTTVNTQVWSPGYVDDLVLRDQSVTITDPENGPSTTLERLYGLALADWRAPFSKLAEGDTAFGSTLADLRRDGSTHPRCP